MGQDITYQWIEDGMNEVLSITDTANINLETSGYADLTNGRVIVQSYHSGKAIILSRNQDNISGFGHLYVYTPNTIQGVSFEIRSSNVADNGTVFWQIVE